MPNDAEQYWLGHRARLREKARTVGIEALHPYEIVELILYQSDLRADMAEQARALIGRFGTIGAVLSAPRDALLAVPGMKRQAADWIIRTGELTRRFAAATAAPQLRIWRAKDLIGFVSSVWRDVPAPQTWMLYTDYDDRLLMRSVLCDSLGWADSMIAQQILREALALQARRAFLVCFTGPEPLRLTPEEREFLNSLAVTLQAVRVELLDVLLVGESGFHSLNQAHEMDDVRAICENLRLHERYTEEDASWRESPDL
ncbi:MAG: hypothetical protein IJH86_06935 [Clostridia bacterium]|nr:hypothetical protein [Clostridia bacterium]